MCLIVSFRLCLGHNSYGSFISTLSKFFKITKNCLYLIKLKRNVSFTTYNGVLWPFIRALRIQTEILSPRESRARVRNKRDLKSIQLLDDMFYVRFNRAVTFGRCPSRVWWLSFLPKSNSGEGVRGIFFHHSQHTCKLINQKWFNSYPRGKLNC